jgi:trehalose 6-phosphate phosphatase
MEEVLDGAVHRSAEAERWRPAVEEATQLARREAPPGTEVEAKGLTVTLHWRRAPEASGWAESVARRAAATGLVAQPGRMAVELRPPVGADKGTVVTRLAAGYRVVAFFGDDLGDLPAFAALDALAGAGATVAKVAVADEETAPEVSAAADLVVAGPPEAAALLDILAGP